MKTITRIKRNFSDTVVLSGRMMRHTFRSVDTLITVVAMPIMMMLMFVYVFGGAIKTGSMNYINYVVPGILLITIASGASYTAFRINNDVTAGIFDRFHSMPISKSSILGGHVLTSVVVNVFSAVLVALLLGFRAEDCPYFCRTSADDGDYYGCTRPADECKCWKQCFNCSYMVHRYSYRFLYCRNANL